uniref:Uncharacterized protein n=2 Tax=Lutzomyia longipalpis TaxID=7200 RepID=A0A1B0CUX4_LUTLO
MDDECTHCECLPDGEPRCQVSVCRTLMCSKQVKSTGECCPHCDISNTHFCEGHEFCSMVCKNGYQRDNVSECNLCRCAQETPQSASASPSATTASPDQESPTNQMVTFIIGICVVALGLTACVVWWFCWRPEKKSYETVSTVDSRQSSEVAKSNGISGMPYCDIVSLKMNVDGDTLKKTLREQNGTLTNQHNYT